MFGKHLDQGAIATGSANYQGHHREYGVEVGNGYAVGFIPLGDRTRDFQEFGVSYIEERDSVDIATSNRR